MAPQFDPVDFVPLPVEDCVEVSLEARFFAWLERGRNVVWLVVGASLVSGGAGVALALASMGGGR